ncbi:ArsR/SmtB family transcription factor [Terrimonas ferruginea]|uniref:ArsR/SmtB family transcription factor n=1 Tax=Terrimonas ferruginea TaxID=249 RepID=UPI00040955F1|nr:metalloregulator ArsR/SmtB family transcription factor [Terrimonas ferruginea]
MKIRRDVFQAIADPTRRHILETVARQPVNLTTLADKYDMTRQAVSLHVKILSECGLLQITRQGREQWCEAKLKELDEVSRWVDHCRKFWKTKFHSLEHYLDKVQTTKKHK